MERIQVDTLKGKTLVDIKINDADNYIEFKDSDGNVYEMFHSQDCCESVGIDDIEGNLTDLIGSPLLVAEEVNNGDLSAKDVYDDSYTWTFYKFATEKGYVTIKWYGTSNGYYSEGVDFYKR